MAVEWEGDVPGTFINESIIVPLDADNMNAISKTLKKVTDGGANTGLDSDTWRGLVPACLSTVSNENISTYYSFDSYFGGSHIDDDTGNDNSGTVYGSLTTEAGISGRSGIFNGTSTYIDGKYTNGSAYTVSAWFKGTISTGVHKLVSLFSDNTNVRLGIVINLGVAEFRWKNASGTIQTIVGASVNDGVYHNITVVHNGTTGYIYIDGILKSQLAQTLFSTYYNKVRIGATEESTPSLYLTGRIDEIKVYTRAFSNVEAYGNFFTKTGIKSLVEESTTHRVYVDNSRTDTYTPDGSLNKPFKTIQTAHDSITTSSATNTYEIYAISGLEYNENLTLSANYISISFSSDPLGVGYRGTLVCTSTNITFNNFYFKSTDASTQDCILTLNQSTASSVIFDHCKFFNVLFNGSSGANAQIKMINCYMDNCDGAIGYANILNSYIYQNVLTVNPTVVFSACQFIQNTITLASTGTLTLGDGYYSSNTITYPTGSTLSICLDFLQGSNTLTGTGGTLVNKSKAIYLDTTQTRFINVDVNRVDTYTPDGTTFKPYKTIATAVASITSDCVLNILPGSYTETTITIPNYKVVVYGNNATLTCTSITNQASQYTQYDLNIVGAVIFNTTSSSATFTIINGFVGNITTNTAHTNIIIFNNTQFTGSITGGANSSITIYNGKYADSITPTGLTISSAANLYIYESVFNGLVSGYFLSSTNGILKIVDSTITNTTSPTQTISCSNGALVTAQNTIVNVDCGSGTLTFGTAYTKIAKTTGTISGSNVSGITDMLTSVSMNIGSDATGDIYYRDSNGKLARLAIGTTGQYLQVASGIPSWISLGGFDSNIRTLTTGESVTAGQLCYLKSDGKAWLANATLEATSVGDLYIAQYTVATSTSTTFLKIGDYTTTGLTAGSNYFLATSFGGITTTAPNAVGNVVRIIGTAISSTVLHFNPSNDYLVLQIASSETTNAGYTFINGQQEADVSGYNTYDDASGSIPTDGVGGSPTVTYQWNSTTPLIGGGDGALSKIASNKQGQGVSHDFTIDRGQLSSPAQITFVYKTSANYVSGDIGVYIYDTTNATLIYPSVVDLPATYGGISQFLLVFNPSTSLNYRLIFHIATTNATAWTVNVDNIQLGQKNVAVGAAISNPVEFPMVITAYTTNPTKGTVVTDKAFWSRDGKRMIIDYSYKQTAAGTAGSGTYFYTLPFPIDTTVHQNNAVVGTAFLSDSATEVSPTSLVGQVYVVDATHVLIKFVTPTDTTNSVHYQDSGNMGLNSTVLIIKLQISAYCSQWTSNVNLASDFTEYASNISATDANDDTPSNYYYGMDGSPFPSLTAQRTKTVAFKRPIQPSDAVDLYIASPSAPNTWFKVGCASVSGADWHFQQQGASTYGMSLSYNTDPYKVNINFGKNPFADGATFGAASSAGWSSYTAWRWCVRKVSNSNMAETRNDFITAITGERIHKKVFTGTSASTAGGAVTITHGLTLSKIISITGSLSYTTNRIPLNYIQEDGGRLIHVATFLTDTGLVLYNDTLMTASYFSKPFIAIIEYME